MLDAVAVAQHHDAITGTGKQHTSDDYKSRIFKAMEQTNPVYAAVISEFAKGTGINSNNWTWCFR
jgi:hypothetical protein